MILATLGFIAAEEPVNDLQTASVSRLSFLTGSKEIALVAHILQTIAFHRTFFKTDLLIIPQSGFFRKTASDLVTVVYNFHFTGIQRRKSKSPST